MKILLLNQVFYPDPVATAQHVTDLARFLKAQGHEVTVMVGQRNYERREIRYPSLENFQGVEIRRVASTGLGKRRFWHRLVDSLTFDFCLIWELARLPPQDLVVSFTSPPLIGVVGALFCRLRGGRSVQWLMDINPDIAIEMGYLSPRSPAARFLTWLLERSLAWSYRIIVLDRWMRERAINHGADQGKLVVIPPWPVHEIEASPQVGATGNPFRRAQGLDGKFVVLYSGNHSIVHPLDTLLDAAVRLKDDPDVKFVFIGGGLRVKDVTQTVRANGLTNVLQLPHQPREMLPFTLSAADLHVVVMGERMSGLVHTSKIYGVLATGKPFVFIGPLSSHLGDLMSELPTGFHVEHGEGARLVEVIREAQRLSAERLKTIARANVEYLLRQVTEEKCLSRFTAEVISPALAKG